MRVAGGIITLNGMPTLPYVVEAALEIVDHLYIVEGAIPAAKAERQPGGWFSTDGTGEFLSRLEKEDPRVTVMLGREAADKDELWNIWLDKASSQLTNYLDAIFVLDDDEIPESREAAAGALAILKSDPMVDCVALPPLNFFTTINTVARGGMFSQPHRRIWRVRHGERFTAHRPPALRPNERVVTAPCQLFHYSWIGRQRALEKCKFYESLRPDHPQYGRQVEWFCDVYERVLDGKAPLPGWGYHVSETRMGASILEAFEGQHPAVIAAALESGEVVFQ